MCINAAYTVFLAGKSPNIRSRTPGNFRGSKNLPFSLTPKCFCVARPQLFPQSKEMCGWVRVYCRFCCMRRVGQNRVYAPYMTEYLVISLSQIPYIHRIYIGFWPTLYMRFWPTLYKKDCALSASVSMLVWFDSGALVWLGPHHKGERSSSGKLLAEHYICTLHLYMYGSQRCNLLFGHTWWMNNRKSVKSEKLWQNITFVHVWIPAMKSPVRPYVVNEQ